MPVSNKLQERDVLNHNAALLYAAAMEVRIATPEPTDAGTGAPSVPYNEAEEHVRKRFRDVVAVLVRDGLWNLR